MPNQTIIDLNIARTSPEAIVLAGRKRGEYWRRELKLEALDLTEQPVTISIPADIISLNISFFLNLFGDSVRKLGPERFREHYLFRCDPLLEPAIKQGVEQALKSSNALPE